MSSVCAQSAGLGKTAKPLQGLAIRSHGTKGAPQGVHCSVGLGTWQGVVRPLENA